MLSLLDRLSSCWWGCRGGDHVPEYLVGRAAGDLRSALQLLRTGYYDESLALTRNAGETTNLLFLFDGNSAAFENWKALPARERWNRYRPAAVRRQLAADGHQVVLSDERYSALSELTHATPTTMPQGHNPFGLPSQAAVFQPSGALVALNEAALVAALIAIPASSLIDHGTPRRLEILEAGQCLAAALGGATVLEIDKYYEMVRSASRR